MLVTNSQLYTNIVQISYNINNNNSYNNIIITLLHYFIIVIAEYDIMNI